MTTYLNEGFEGTLPGQFTETYIEQAGNTTMVLQNQHVLSGLQSLRITTAGMVGWEGAWCVKYASLADAWTKFNAKIINVPAMNWGDRLWFAYMWGPNYYAAAQAYFGIEKHGEDGTTRWVLLYYTGVGPAPWDPTIQTTLFESVYSNPITLDNNLHEIKLRCLNSTSGVVEAYVDGVLVAASSVHDTTITGNSTYLGVGFVSTGAIPSIDVVIDDAVIADTNPSGVIPPPGNGSLLVTATAGTAQIAASVIADGQSGITPVAFTFPVGTYSVIASYQGQTLAPQTVTIADGQTTTINLQFPTPPIPSYVAPLVIVGLGLAALYALGG